ncbi:Cytochrome b [Rhodovastum atsumiense]|uniref:Cytochrome b n=1 Tax=Rhodovastum atsumiense TaxID=504468 RepID=A0A5M6J1B7_9PROT|nr:cytochrome b [Rhodovastum atsumiense]KAA5614390.1 cytochrome b [Rhodovastum atsumiense]CAH2604867.1 Cytochrome b [Rhodovastum atsumiense]
MSTTTASIRIPRYSFTARTYHWITVLLMAGMFLTYWVHELAGRDNPLNAAAMNLHTSFGLLILGLTVLRLLIRPRPPQVTGPFIGELLRKSMHYLLLTATLLLPITGYLRRASRGRASDFFGYQIPSLTGDWPAINEAMKLLHGDIMQYALLALIGLHAAAALGHHYLLKDDTLRRML